MFDVRIRARRKRADSNQQPSQLAQSRSVATTTIVKSLSNTLSIVWLSASYPAILCTTTQKNAAGNGSTTT